MLTSERARRSVAVNACREAIAPMLDAPAAARPDASVIICTNRPAGLAAAVRSVLANREPAFELLVVAQGPDAAWAARELDDRRADPRLRIVHDPGRGLSHARNVGIGQARGELILFTDDDCLVAEDWVSAHLSCYAAHPDAMLVYGTVAAPSWYAPADGVVPVFHPSAGSGLSGGHRRVTLGMGANMSLRRELIRRVGPFDEQLGPGGPLTGADDFDVSLRATAAGLRVVADDGPRVVHEGGVRRPGPESQSLWQRDGFGIGALVAKQVRTGHWLGARVLAGGVLRIFRQALAAELRRQRPSGLRMALLLTRGALGGFLVGMRQPLARQHGSDLFLARR